jgi:dipeptidyl aminopeptidase/acylaminoacyl peptidase
MQHGTVRFSSHQIARNAVSMRPGIVGQAMKMNIVLIVCWLSYGLPVESVAAQARQPFSVNDDIEITQFGDGYGDVLRSPSGDKILVHTVRASIEDGKLHEELRVYDVSKVSTFVKASDRTAHIEQEWELEESTGSFGEEDGSIVTNMRWLDDESGIAFLLRLTPNHTRLCVAKLGSKIPRQLSSDEDNVLGFAIRDDRHYAFTVASRETKRKAFEMRAAPFQVGTKQSLWDSMIPEQMVNFIGRGDLWAANGGKPSPVTDPATGRPVILYEAGTERLSLSPDGTTLVTIVPVPEVPKQWEALYPPPFPDDIFRLRGGKQNLDDVAGPRLVGEYVQIALGSGKITSLTNAPEAMAAGWFEAFLTQPQWSKDGVSILLPGTFIFDPSASGARPCIAVAQPSSGTSECVRSLQRDSIKGYEAGRERINVAAFVDGRGDRVMLKQFNHNNSDGDTERRFVRSEKGSWLAEEQSSERSENKAIEVKVKASFRDPPVLIATDTASGRSRVILDPNPQLQAIAFGDAELYNWNDKSGRKWEGILYKPINYRPGVKYPFVLQNHGFSVDHYTPSGGFYSAFVAQELASAGIIVLQLRDCAERNTPTEGPCNVEGYESAVDRLTKDGLIDPSRIGIIGFSRTVFYVLEALTTSTLHFEAASISDGINLGYMEYLCNGMDSNFTQMDEAMVGSRPFGSGLQVWLKNAPVFNMSKVATPLRIVSRRGAGLLEMWEPYVLLEEMHKPVDLIVLNTDQHVINDPTIRLAAQGGNVDWFRFWLQCYEDPDPSKRDQYARWRRLRDLSVGQGCGIPERKLQ